MAQFCARRGEPGSFRLIRRLTGAAFVLLVTIGVAFATQSHANWTLGTVLRNMDSEARDFRSLTANIERTKVTVVVNDKSTETGRLFIRGDNMRIDLSEPDTRTILRSGNNLYIYNPKLSRVEEYDLGKNRALVDQFLLLGFGTSGHELEKNYEITLVDEETLDTRKVVQLELTPKSDKVRDQISKIQIWLDEADWLPVQQKFSETGTKDYFIIHYTNVVRNPKIHDTQFKPRWPKGTTKVRPQG
jgi:outer membrane lipoprotein-sorting protein